MSTATEIDCGTVQSLDWAVPCDGTYAGIESEKGRPDHPCDNPAEWVVQAKCCGVPALTCDPCRKSATRTHRQRGHDWYCSDCDAPLPYPTLYDCGIWEPLGRIDTR